jgi:hypothetical protein
VEARRSVSCISTGALRTRGPIITLVNALGRRQLFFLRLSLKVFVEPERKFYERMNAARLPFALMRLASLPPSASSPKFVRKSKPFWVGVSL